MLKLLKEFQSGAIQNPDFEWVLNTPLSTAKNFEKKKYSKIKCTYLQVFEELQKCF